MANNSQAGYCCYIALGSNLGDRQQFLQNALGALAALPGTTIESVSAVYETAPVGPVPQGNYYNAVACVRTALDPAQMLRACLHIESKQGRVRAERFGPRTLDLDLLWHEQQPSLHSETLTLPHPRLHERGFVLIPLAELTTDLIINGHSVAHWLERCPADGVRKLEFTLCLAD